MERRCDELVALLETQIDHYRCLKQALASEAKAGAAGDTVALAKAVTAKEEVVAALRTCEIRRRRLLSPGTAAAGLTLSEMADRFPGPKADRLKELGRTLKDEIAEAQRLNRSNGDLIAHCLKLVQQSIAVLNHLLVPQLVYQPVGVPAYRNGVTVHRFSRRA